MKGQTCSAISRHRNDGAENDRDDAHETRGQNGPANTERFDRFRSREGKDHKQSAKRNQCNPDDYRHRSFGGRAGRARHRRGDQRQRERGSRPEWNAGAVRSEGEVNSIFTAENAEERREVQREK